MIDLSGPWRALPADDELRRQFPQPTLDDANWETVHVPHHWRNTPAFSSLDGPLLYRRSFETPLADPATGDVPQRWWLQLDGVFYQGDVWLDGTYLGDTEGYFAAHTFEVTDALAAASEHTLAVEVACAAQNSRKAKRNLTGVFQHWDCIDPDWNPGGIWRPVRLVGTGPVRMERLRVLCVEASAERAVLALRANLDTRTQQSVRVRTRVAGTEHELEQTLASGMNRVEWRVTIDNPGLWWPHAMGDAVLTEVEVRVEDPSSGVIHDQRRRRTGLRQVRARNWMFEINGERIYLKGANQGPARMAIAESTAAELRHDLQLARDTGLDFLRIHAHISRPELYSAADELGMLLWQDLPLQWGYARSVRRPAVEQAREAVDLLGHHPSIFHWSGHNEPLALDVEMGESMGEPKRAATMIGKYLALQELPTWNKSVLDLAIHRALIKADPSRSSAAHSGVLPGPFSGGTDAHLYFGWYHGAERDLPHFLAAVPRMARFVSEFGAQAVPQSAEFCEPHLWPHLDWDRLTRTHALQRLFMERHTPTDGHDTFESWAAATQQYQGQVLRRHIEELRRLKYLPGGGFAMFSWADARDHAAITWSVLDHHRVPKAGLASVAAACAPVIVVCDRPPALLAPGMVLNLDVHVVSDLRTTLRGATVSAELTWHTPGDTSPQRALEPVRWNWEGDCPADHVVRVGSVVATVPALVDGSSMQLDVVLTQSDHHASNHYRSDISAAAPSRTWPWSGLGGRKRTG